MCGFPLGLGSPKTCWPEATGLGKGSGPPKGWGWCPLRFTHSTRAKAHCQSSDLETVVGQVVLVQAAVAGPMEVAHQVARCAEAQHHVAVVVGPAQF